MRVPLGKTRLHDFFLKFIDPKIGFGHNFWLEGPIDLRTTRLNYILQDLFRDTPLNQIWSAQICIFGQGTRMLKIGVKIQKKNCISLVLTLMLILTMTMMMFITSMCKVRHRQDGALVPYHMLMLWRLLFIVELMWTSRWRSGSISAQSGLVSLLRWRPGTPPLNQGGNLHHEDYQDDF